MDGLDGAGYVIFIGNRYGGLLTIFHYNFLASYAQHLKEDISKYSAQLERFEQLLYLGYL